MPKKKAKYTRAKMLKNLAKARAAKKRIARNRSAGAKQAVKTKLRKYGKNLKRG